MSDFDSTDTVPHVCLWSRARLDNLVSKGVSILNRLTIPVNYEIYIAFERQHDWRKRLKGLENAFLFCLRVCVAGEILRKMTNGAMKRQQ